ncbi:MAG TPA: hypothetical protein VMB81_01195 [Candidatus Sulfotelmatobacter sp.]|nr:hypothetical protein [Candidatus Sulfotelmatobacter sp.]
MTRALTVIAGLLLASGPALAVEGSYRGSYQIIEGDLWSCGEPRAIATVTLKGASAHGVSVSGFAHLRMFYGDGEVSPDGSIKMTWHMVPDPYNFGTTSFDGSVTGDAIIAVSQNNRCRVRWTLTKGFFW